MHNVGFQQGAAKKDLIKSILRFNVLLIVISLLSCGLHLAISARISLNLNAGNMPGSETSMSSM